MSSPDDTAAPEAAQPEAAQPEAAKTAAAEPRAREEKDRGAARRSSRRRWVFGIVALASAGIYGWIWASYPSDRTPEGAYLRIVTAVNRGKPGQFFAYTEEAAQHACYTIRDYRREALEHIRSSYPEPKRTEWIERYRSLAEAPDGADVFAVYADERGWVDRLRRDMSGIERIEVSKERATVQTVQGTRYPFRKRPNGIWGSTLFTAELVTEAETTARDLELVKRAAADFRRAAARRLPASSSSAAER